MAADRKMSDLKTAKPRQLTLRLAPALHARLSAVAYRSGMPVNKLVGHLLPQALSPAEKALAEYERVVGESARVQSKRLKAWLRENPGGTFEQFVQALMDHLKRKFQGLSQPTGPPTEFMLGVEDTDWMIESVDDVVLGDEGEEAQEESHFDDDLDELDDDI